MSIPLTITSPNISFSKLFKVFKHTNTIDNNIELRDFIRDDLIIFTVPENYDIPTTTSNIELRDFINAIYINPLKTIDLTISNSYITTRILPKTKYINNFNLYKYLLQTLDIYSIKSNLFELTINLNLSDYQFVDNTSGADGAFVIDMDDFTASFDKLSKITINNDMYITGKHGEGAGNPITPPTDRGKGGAGENGTDGGDAVIINSTSDSSITVEIKDLNKKIIGGFGAQGGNGGNGGTKNVYLYFSTTQYSVSRAQGGDRNTGNGGQIKLIFTDTWVETITNPYHPHAEDSKYHIIWSGEMEGSGIYFDRNPNYIDAYGRILFYLYDASTTAYTNNLATTFTGQNATNGQNATSPLIGVHHAGNPFDRTEPSQGNIGPFVDGYYNSDWTSDGGDPGTNGEDGDTHSFNSSHITVNYIIS
jgi:hypothetical protein